MMSKTSRNAVIALLDGVRRVLVGVLAAGSICFFFLAILDTFRSGSVPNIRLVIYILDSIFGVIERLSSWLHAGWLLQLRQLAALVAAFLLLAVGIFANAGLRALNSQIIRARSR